jgi:riboflavin kinase / FMN adenylyltransferase
MPDFQIIATLNEPLSSALSQPKLVVLGLFDGVHIGHQAVLQQGLELANALGLEPWVFSFATHPRHCLVQLSHGRDPVEELSSLNERLGLFKAMGFKGAIVPAFTQQIRNMSREAFVVDWLKTLLNTKAVVVGYDYCFGKDRLGTAFWLEDQQDALGLRVQVVSAVKREAVLTVSSTAIRACLKQQGDVVQAQALLGRPYSVWASVVKGHERGEKILAFATANLEALNRQHPLWPKRGVYTGALRVRGAWYCAVINIGVAPTFNDATPRWQVEAHLPQWRGGPFYGEDVQVAFLQRVRDERRFDTVAILKAQILSDVQQSVLAWRENEAGYQNDLRLISMPHEVLLPLPNCLDREAMA